VSAPSRGGPERPPTTGQSFPQVVPACPGTIWLTLLRGARTIGRRWIGIADAVGLGSVDCSSPRLPGFLPDVGVLALALADSRRVERRRMAPLTARRALLDRRCPERIHLARFRDEAHRTRLLGPGREVEPPGASDAARNCTRPHRVNARAGERDCAGASLVMRSASCCCGARSALRRLGRDRRRVGGVPADRRRRG
jgi:hypothetical protein